MIKPAAQQTESLELGDNLNLIVTELQTHQDSVPVVRVRVEAPRELVVREAARVGRYDDNSL